MALVLELGLLLLIIAAPAVLTVAGAWRRGCGPMQSLASGVVYPITWAVWYVHDKRPAARDRLPQPTAR